MVRHRVRIRFRKQGDLRWIGHRDLMRCCERWFRRAGIALRRSEGFHPKPRMSFPSALAVGIAGLDEVLEIELEQPLAADALATRLAEHAPEGLSVAAVEMLPPDARKAQVCHVEYTLPVAPQRRDGLPPRIERFLSSPSWPWQRPQRAQQVDLRPWVEELEWDGDRLRLRLRVSQEAGISPRDVLAALELSAAETDGAVITRTVVELCP